MEARILGPVLALALVPEQVLVPEPALVLEPALDSQ